MQSTLLMLFVLLAGQLGDRYPVETRDSDNSMAPEVEAEANTSEVAAEPSTGTDGLFDEIDAAAQPLSPPPQSQPLESESTLELDSQSPVESETATSPPTTTPPAIEPPRNSTSTQATLPENETDPAKVLASFLEAPLNERLQGMPLTLAQAIINSLSRGEQTQRVLAYWELSQAVTNYYLTLDDRTKLAALRQAIIQPSPDWEVATQTTAARIELARDRVRVAQEHLALLMGSTTFGFMPLPSDVPFCDVYETRYAEIFQNRPSQLAQQLNELLPRAHADLTTRTREIADARQWMFKVSDTRSPQADGNDLLKAFELFASRRRMFLGAVMEYNRGIVRYTEIATPGMLETERLVAMLIRTGSSPARTFDSDVQRVNAEEGVNSNDSSSTQPKAPGVSEWQAVPNNGLERSILVPKS